MGAAAPRTIPRAAAGQLTGGIGDSFNYVAVAWLVLQLTGSALAVGSVLTAAAVPRALLMLLGGAINDLLSPRLTMVLSGLLRVVVMGRSPRWRWATP